MTQELIEKIFLNLPLPSEVECDYIVVPFLAAEDLILGPDPETDSAPMFSEITFEKEYVSGIAIGWRLK